LVCAEGDGVMFGVRALNAKLLFGEGVKARCTFGEFDATYSFPFPRIVPSCCLKREAGVFFLLLVGVFLRENVTQDEGLLAMRSEEEEEVEFASYLGQI